MLRSLSALVTRPAALATSVALHLGAVVAGGHALSEGTEDRTGRDTPIEVEVQLVERIATPVALPDPTVPPTSEVALRPPTSTRASRVGHHHAYPVPLDHDAHPHASSLVHLAGAATRAALEPSAAILPSPSAAQPLTSPPSLEPPSSEAPLHFALTSEGLTTRGASRSARLASPVSRGASSGSGAFSSETPLPESAVDAPARLLSSVPVVYPEAARAAGLEADVLLELVVDGDGRVTSARQLSSPSRELADAAARAVRAYRFTPAHRAGRAVSVRMRWTVTFRLQ